MPNYSGYFSAEVLTLKSSSDEGFKKNFAELLPKLPIGVAKSDYLDSQTLIIDLKAIHPDEHGSVVDTLISFLKEKEGTQEIRNQYGSELLSTEVSTWKTLWSKMGHVDKSSLYEESRSWSFSIPKFNLNFLGAYSRGVIGAGKGAQINNSNTAETGFSSINGNNKGALNDFNIN